MTKIPKLAKLGGYSSSQRTPHLPPIQRCATCGAEWIVHHACPNAPRSTSAPVLAQQSAYSLYPTQMEALAAARAEVGRLRQAIHDAEAAILGDGTNEDDRRLHEALLPLWEAARAGSTPKETR